MFRGQGFYSTTQVSRLAGIPLATLYQWRKRGIIAPSIRVVDDNGRLIDEGYSYADLAIAKLLRALRDRELNLRSAAIAFRHLFERFGPPTYQDWNDAHVYVIHKDVFAQKPDNWETTVASRAGQRAEMRVLGDLSEEEAALVIPKDFDGYLEINVAVMDGQPVIRDTRVPTSILAVMSRQGVSVDELTELYRPVPRMAIEKAIEFEQRLDQALEKTTAKA